jgi:predicted nuclease with TOPRIM domain
MFNYCGDDMVSITLAVPKEIKNKMDEFEEMNWSGFVRKQIEQKTKMLEKVAFLEKELEKEKEIIDWSVKLQRSSRKNRLEDLKKKGLI